MSDDVIFGLGFLAQLLFGSRMVIQWILSEKAKRVVSPTLFWKTSLFASALFLVYGLLRQDSVIIFGQLLSYFIYIRNLQIDGEWKKMLSVSRWTFLLLPLFIISGSWKLQLVSIGAIRDSQFYHPLFIAGTAGQLLLNFRFVYQWYLAERTGVSALPAGFWVISLLGSVLLIVYSVFRLDPVLMVAQSMGIVIYSRNIILGRKSNAEVAAR